MEEAKNQLHFPDVSVGIARNTDVYEQHQEDDGDKVDPAAIEALKAGCLRQ